MKSLPGHVYRVQHEKLLEDQEKVTRDLLNFCELDFEHATLEFYKNSRSGKDS